MDCFKRSKKLNRQASFNTFEEKKKGLSIRAGVVKIKDFFTKALSMKTTFVKKVIINYSPFT